MNKIILLSVFAIAITVCAIVYVFNAVNNQDYSVVGTWEIGDSSIRFSLGAGYIYSPENSALGSIYGKYIVVDDILTATGEMRIWDTVKDFEWKEKIRFTNFGNTLILENIKTGVVQTWHRV